MIFFFLKRIRHLFVIRLSLNYPLFCLEWKHNLTSVLRQQQQQQWLQLRQQRSNKSDASRRILFPKKSRHNNNAIFSANEVCNRLGNFVAKMMTSLFRKKKVFWSEIVPFPKIISPEKFGSFRFGRNLFSTTQRKF